MERTGTPLGARITQIALTLIIVGLVVFKVLPGIADWSEVGAALKGAPLSDSSSSSSSRSASRS